MKNVLLILIGLMCQSLWAQSGWTQKSDFPSARWSAVAASIGTKGYVGLGVNQDGERMSDFWEWDQATDSWTRMADFPSTGRVGAVAFAIEDKIYVGTGYDGSPGIDYKKDFWQWNQANNTWTPIADIPMGRAESVAFSIGTKGYVLTGSTNTNISGSNDFWEWDQATNIWIQKSNIPAEGTFLASGFSVGTKGYILMGANSFWEWNQNSNIWEPKTSIATTYVDKAADFSMGDKGYIGGVGQNEDEFWEYTPNTDSWKHLENIPGGRRGISTGFSIGNLAYIGTGFAEPFKKDFWEADPAQLCSYATMITQPTNQTASLFENAVFSLESMGSNLIYQWQTDTGNGFENLTDSGQYSGTNTNTLTISEVTTNNSDQWFRCVISSGFCSTITNTVLLHVNCIPLIAVQPENQEVALGNSAELAIESPYANLSYQWQVNSGLGFQNLSNDSQYTGVNTANLTISSVLDLNYDNFYRCWVAAGACTETSTEVHLTSALNTDTPLQNSNRLTVYPNPVKDYFKIHVQPELIGFNYSLYDMMGKEIISGKSSSEITTVMMNVDSGLYFLKIKSNKDWVLKISKL